jgi:uncharacterized protein (TIRG00374 family)
MAMFFNLAVLVCLVGGLLLVFGQNILDRWPLFRKLRDRTSVGDILAKVYDAFHLCLSHRGLVLQTFLISLLNHTFVVLSGYFIGRALGLPLHFIDYLTVLPIVNLVAAIPITPAGLGTREAATMFLLSTMGVPEATSVTLSLLMYGATLAWSLLGGVVYAGYVVNRGKAKVDNVDSDRAG